MVTKYVSWTVLKDFSILKNINIQWYESDFNTYEIFAIDNSLSLTTSIPLDDSYTSDKEDFETNFKASGNKPTSITTVVNNQPPYGSKTITVNGVTKRLFARFTGQQYSVSQGSNTLSYTITYPWVKIIGVEVIGCEVLDTASLKVYDNAQGTYSGVPNALLNQFSFSLVLPKDFYQRMAQFDADIYQGMVVQIDYISISNKTVGVNFLINEVKT